MKNSKKSGRTWSNSTLKGLKKKDLDFIDKEFDKMKIKPPKTLTGLLRPAIVPKSSGAIQKQRVRNKKKGPEMEKTKQTINNASKEVQRFAAFLAIVVIFAYFGFDYFNGDSIGTALSTVAGMVAVSKIRV